MNYLTQLLPGPVNRYFDFENSVYFESSGVFDEYSWNGGINVISFYANFGYFGLIIFGMFVHYYILHQKLLYSKNILLLIISLFMFSTVMQVFWYELIQIIKPVLFIMLLYLSSCYSYQEDMNEKDQDKLYVINIDEEGRFGGPEKRIVQVASALKIIILKLQLLFQQKIQNILRFHYRTQYKI